MWTGLPLFTNEGKDSNFPFTLVIREVRKYTGTEDSSRW